MMFAMPKARAPIGTQRRFSLLQRDAFTCLFCTSRPGNDRLHIDHFIPFSRGGSDHDNNLGTVCDRCNNGKSNRIAIPLSICAGDRDRNGWITWKRWGDWVIHFNPDPDQEDSDDPLIDNAAIALTFQPNALDYWIALDRVHDETWHEHVGWKPWLHDDYEAIEYVQDLERMQSPEVERPLFVDLATWLKESDDPRIPRLKRFPVPLAEVPSAQRHREIGSRRARGERWLHFCDALQFARTLIAKPVKMRR